MSKRTDAYATMLLTMALSANREEYARPYSVGEYEQLAVSLGRGGFTVGDLLNKDIGDLMMRFSFSQEDAYRVFTLLNRAVQLQFFMERFANLGISAVTRFDEPVYPKRLNAKLKKAAPPFLYYAGNMELSTMPLLAIMGISGIKTNPELRESIIETVERAVSLGYGIVTGGEPGVSRVAAGAVLKHGGCLVEVPGGGMCEHITDEMIKPLLEEGRTLVLCAEHPESMFTVTHAIARNKIIFALSDAALICNTDNKRGEVDALVNHTCERVYAWTGYPANQNLIRRGAIPIADFRNLDAEELNKCRNYTHAVQLSFFDEGDTLV